MLKNKGADPRKYIKMLVNWGFEISIIGFDGPFLNIPEGNEMSVFSGYKEESNLFCKLGK